MKPLFDLNKNAAIKSNNYHEKLIVNQIKNWQLIHVNKNNTTIQI